MCKYECFTEIRKYRKKEGAPEKLRKSIVNSAREKKAEQIESADEKERGER